MHERPNDVRGFLHKRIGGAIKGLISGGPLGALTGALTSGGQAVEQVRTFVNTISPRPPIGGGSQFTGILGGTGICPPGTPGCNGARGVTGTGCPAGTVPDPRGFCVDPQSPLGEGVFGEVQSGRYGVGTVPEAMSVVTRECPRRMVLGNDGLCYDKRVISNANRMWPRGRRPLLTGGDMRAISIANKAATKLKAKQKQLVDMGMLTPIVRTKTKTVAAPYPGKPPGTTIVQN